MANNLAPRIPEVIQTIFPTIMEVAGNIVISLCNGIISNLPQLANQGMMMIIQLLNGILLALPQIFPVAVSLITSLAQTII